MKAVVGIDVTQESLHAVGLLGHLGFTAPQLQLVHVIERLSPEEWANRPRNANDLLTQFLHMQEKEGQEWLDKAAALAREYQLPAETSMKYGNTVANQLLETAQEYQADLVAIGSRDESALGKLLIGSVGRKLATNSPLSLCICRHDMPTSVQTIDAVFATDHSEYASRCVDTLVQLAPRGIRRLTLMTAYPKQMVKTLRNFQPHVPADVSKWIEVHLEQENSRIRDRLSPLGCDIQSRIMISDPDEAIDATMRQTGSQLLIMGAQGRGFLERLTTGSHTFRQAVTGKHSLLILRAPH
ncbi:universal stress protein [Oligoflexus tunisiensis]|uniref:universal stress protein n=1 Tax=Oligoflexus tunisiensis TaxID=708132 RepID=UPI00159F29E5|nr:universal stress protein [Oligoflexus tunisiensis]